LRSIAREGFGVAKFKVTFTGNATEEVEAEYWDQREGWLVVIRGTDQVLSLRVGDVKRIERASD
jgi:hypothetical protein